MKVFKRNNYIQVSFSDGTSFSSTEDTDSLWEFLEKNMNNEGVVRKKLLGNIYTGMTLLKKVEVSSILKLKGNSVYMPDVSNLTIPEDFVEKIIEAEENGDEKELRKFKNFWTLVSLNPDSRVRNNLFWFIRKWDMRITDSGLIIAYRNADIKSEAKYSTEFSKDVINRFYQEKYINHNNPYEIYDSSLGKKSLGQVYDEIVNGGDSPIYTDQHTHSTTIKLGQPVRMPREECDSNQENSCSRG